MFKKIDSGRNDQFYKNGLALKTDEVYQLSEDQKNALISIKNWWKNKSKQYFVLGGCAGSGKSSLISFIIKQLGLEKREFDVLKCAITGKATLVLKRKGFQANTVHSIIYETTKKIVDDKIYFQFHKRDYLPYSLIIVDQASMISEQVFNDVLSFNIPVIFIGDHQQLPPVKSTFNIMSNPDFRMQKVLRQLQESPIIQLSIKAIRGQKIPFKQFSDGVQKIHYDDLTDKMLLDAGQIIVGTHNKRIIVNQTIRQLYGYGQNPCDGQKLIAISNSKPINIYNGQIVYLVKDAIVKKDHYQIQIIDQLQKTQAVYAVLSQPRKITATIGLGTKEILNKKYGTTVGHFNFGYAITAHASQGSSWEDVMVMDDKFGIWESKQLYHRHLYTCITRAQKTLTIVSKS